MVCAMEDEELEMEYRPTNREKRKMLRKVRLDYNFEELITNEQAKISFCIRRNKRNGFNKED